MTTDAADTQKYDDTPRGQAARWAEELKMARNALEKWHRQGTAIDKRFKDEREGHEESEVRLNLFHADVETQLATLYGQVPRVSVSRRFADADDDVARVAAECLERLLNSDIERDSDTFAQALEYALQDWLLPGLGQVRVRYVAKTETQPGTAAILDEETGAELAPAVPETEAVTYECVETDYVHWRDFLWSPARVWHEVRWVAFGADMPREAFVERFGEEKAALVSFTTNKERKEEGKDASPSPWGRARVWEVWDKERREVVWVAEGAPEVLDTKPDTLGLESFFPCPLPLVANATTTALLPRPDYTVAQDLYKQVDEYVARVALLVGAVKAAGVYDKAAGGSVQKLLEPTSGNVLVPVDNWAMFAEKGGLRGVIDWMPLEAVVNAIQVLNQQLAIAKDHLYEVTGKSDLQRGASDPRETAAAQGIKAKFGSVRLQRRQDRLARFASDVQRLKAEIVAKHFQPATILQAANFAHTYEGRTQPQVGEQAVALLKERHSEYRVGVKPEALSLTDFAQLKSERMEVVQGVSTFLQAAAPIVQQVPGSLPFLLKVLQATVAGLRGSSTLEGILDGAIAAAEQQAAQPQGQGAPDPKLQAQQMKTQGDLAKVDAELKADIVRTQVEVQADAQREMNQRQQNVLEAQQKAAVSSAFRPVQQVKPGGLP